MTDQGFRQRYPILPQPGLEPGGNHPGTKITSRRLIDSSAHCLTHSFIHNDDMNFFPGVSGHGKQVDGKKRTGRPPAQDDYPGTVP